MSGIVNFPWFSKSSFLQTKFSLPESSARAILDLHKKGYKFTDRFMKAFAEQPALQAFFTKERIAIAETVGFSPPVLARLNEQLPFSMTVENKTIDLEEKENKTQTGAPHIRPPIAAASIESASLSVEERIEAAKEMSPDQLQALEPKALVEELRAAWAKKDPAAFLVAYIKLARLSFVKFSRDISDVMVTMDEKELPSIADAMQGKATPGFYLVFSSGTAGERWYFKSSYDKDKPNIHYSPSGPYDFSEVFIRSLQGCPGFEARGDHLFLYLE
jgi:hypothetical protein